MDYEKLLALVNKYKVLGKSPNEIRDLLDAYFEIEGIDKASSIDVPTWDSTGTIKTGSDQVALDKVIDGLVGKEDTPEEKVKKEEAVSKSNAIKEAQHKERMEALPENQKQSEAEQARITEGYKNEVHPDISEGGRDALYADLDKAKDAGFIKMVDNNINRLAGKDNDEKFAFSVIDELVKAKNAGKEFSKSFSKKLLTELAKRFPNTKDENGKTINNIKDVINGLHATFKHELFGRLKSSLNMIESKGNSAKSRLAREFERVAETDGTEAGAQEATARSVRPGSVAKREGVTDFNKAFAGGTEADAAKAALAQDVNAYDDKFLWSAIVGNMKKSGKIDKNMTDDEIRQNPELIKQINDQIAAANNKVRQYVSDAQQAKYSVDDWVKYFEEHPGVRFHNSANMRTVNNGVLNLTAINTDADGKETMEKFPLIKESDITNFLQALQKVETKPEITTEFTNLSTKNTDAVDDSSRNKKWVDRFNKMFSSGDKFSVYADPRLSKKTVRDENGFVTEYDRDPTKASGSNLRNADYFNQLAGIMKDTKNAVPNLVELITAQHGKDAAAKAQNLYNDVTELNSVFGPVLEGDNIDPSTLRSFAGKFNRLRKNNPNMSLTDIFNSGDVSDVFGVKVHPKFTGNDKFSRLDLLKAALKLAKYKKDAAKAGVDWDALRSDLDDNIQVYQNAVNNKNFTGLPEGMDEGIANDVLEALKQGRSYVETPAEREAKLRGMFVDTPDKSSLKSLADEAPEEYEKAEADYKDAMNEYALAKQNKDTDFDVLNELRREAEEARSKMEYLKNTKVDILKRAEELGKPYQEVLDDYLHPDWDEDDMELNIQKQLAEYDLNDQLKEQLGGSAHNSNVKAAGLEKILDTLSGVDPRFEDWRDRLNSWARPVAASQLMSSVDTAKQYLDMTPAEWSAYNTNKGFFDSDVEQKRRNTTLTGQRKSAKGIAGADTVALDKLAKDLQYMDYTDDTAGKQALYNKLQADNKKASDPYTRNLDIDERLANAIRGVLADRPEEN